MKQWHALTIEETKNVLAKHNEHLSVNEIKDMESSRWFILLARQFTNILILVLLIATLLSFFLGDIIDALAILAIVLFNGLLGFVQEWKAQNAIKNLKNMLTSQCRVIRNGLELVIDVKKLVPGDCVLMDGGDIVPADIRITAVADLMINEATLTGESEPITKITERLPAETLITDRKNMAYMGTHVMSGQGQGLVVAIGMDTEFGRLAELTGSIHEEETELQKQLSFIGKRLGLLAIITSVGVILIGVLAGFDPIRMLMTGISLAVSAIPEGLPAVVTIALALGARAMAKKKALLRHLQAAETLGAVSIICTDKTGTLTQNEMKVQVIWLFEKSLQLTGVGYTPEGEFILNGEVINPQSLPELMTLLETGYQCNHARIYQEGEEWKIIGSPDEAALLVAAVKSGLSCAHPAALVKEFTFDSIKKRMTVIEDAGDFQIIHSKGAPEVILPLCTYYLFGAQENELNSDSRNKIENAYINLAQNGLRTLALARKIVPKHLKLSRKEAENNLVFIGLVGFMDPPREEIPRALATAKNAGIKVVMITGDSPVTAKAIANQIGLHVDKVITSSELKTLSDHKLKELLKQNVLFARTIPEDKFRIVKLFQDQGQLVAMTGDGVNDAPALKQADIGIAMGIRGTDVARSVADIVLSDDNFASIIDAVEEGRRQYANLRKFVLYLASSNLGEVLAILISLLLSGGLIVIPVQILWINLVTDSATALSLSVERAEKGIMHRPPRQADKPIFDRMSLILVIAFGAYIGMVTFLVYQLYFPQSYELANTIAFTSLVVLANIHTLNFRSFYKPIYTIGWFSNKWILIALLSMLGLHVMAIYNPGPQRILHTVPLSISHWGVILLCALPIFLIPELYKMIKNKGS
ncbi:cation-translocating P-type ATPase [Fluoribacter dumoffii]|uniref:Calcium-transporting ATPase n=1 Tax=Fluoribacter dumoffii TaxID=463 RepID=A0A377G7G2_9GAMM|nr:cation-transporting P-type ATPase [Fluoribacter dumoffii]KTC89332.1 cation efflux transporter [Fluoribacter dumoffii NY 23]STO20441.1 Calcium-transporting ATPase [Fluoribacter dumoffii]